MTPERAPSAVFEVLKLAGAGFVALAGLTVVGESVHPLKQLGFPHLAAIAYDLSGYKLVTGAAFTALGAMMFGYPLRYFFANMFRPRMPSEQQVLEAYLEGEIDEKTAKRMMGYHGYADDYFPMMVAVADRSVSPVMLSRIAQAGYYDKKLFEQAFADAHYGFAVRPALHQYMQQVAAGELKAVYASVAISRYREGFTDRYLFLEELKMLRVQEALRGPYLSAGNLMRDYDLRSEVLKEAKRALRQGDIDMGTFIAIVQDLELDPDYWTRWRMWMERIPKESTPASKEVEVRAEGKDILLRRFRAGITTEESFRSEAVLCGYTPEQIDRLLVIARLLRDYDAYVEAKKAEESKREEVRAMGKEVVIKRFREGLTVEEGFRSEAALCGYTPEQVERMFVQALLDRDYDYCMDRLKAAHDAYDAGVLDDETFPLELADFLRDPDRINLELLKAKYRKLPKVKRKAS
jgi:hypothetical protein